MSSDNENEIEMEVKIEGEGEVFDPAEKDISEADTKILDEKTEDQGSSDAVEYGAGAERDPMEEMAEEVAGVATEADEAEENTVPDEQSEVKEPIQETTPDKMQKANKEVIELSEGEVPRMSESTREEFNTQQTQAALADDDAEGGIVSSRHTAGHSMSSHKDDGEILKPKPDMERDSLAGKYEVTGFTVEYVSKSGSVHSVQIRDYFEDLDAAFASINGSKYLMPMPRIGYKIAKITLGAPIICFEERQLYEFKNNTWVRT